AKNQRTTSSNRTMSRLPRQREPLGRYPLPDQQMRLDAVRAESVTERFRSLKSVLALDDAGHYKVVVAGSAKYRHQVTGAQQPQDPGTDTTQQHCGLTAVSCPNHDGGPGQRIGRASCRERVEIAGVGG